MYVGMWNDGLQNGKGHQVWRNGLRFSGEFREGRPYGSGKLVDEKRRTVQGTWIFKDDVAQQEEVIAFESSDGDLLYPLEGLSQENSNKHKVSLKAQRKIALIVFVFAILTVYLIASYSNNTGNLH